MSTVRVVPALDDEQPRSAGQPAPPVPDPAGVVEGVAGAEPIDALALEVHFELPGDDVHELVARVRVVLLEVVGRTDELDRIHGPAAVDQRPGVPPGIGD